jgi:hypothetical protein
MLTELCAELRNYFEVPNGRHFGKFTISGGSIEPLDFLQEGQYFRIVGSVFNDGVYQYTAASLTDEVFDGAVWAMAVPPSVIALAAKIKSYNDDPNNAPSGIVSESVGGHSVSRATNSRGVAAGWRSVFAEDLNKWRKL